MPYQCERCEADVRRADSICTGCRESVKRTYRVPKDYVDPDEIKPQVPPAERLPVRISAQRPVPSQLKGYNRHDTNSWPKAPGVQDPLKNGQCLRCMGAVRRSEELGKLGSASISQLIQELGDCKACLPTQDKTSQNHTKMTDVITLLEKWTKKKNK